MKQLEIGGHYTEEQIRAFGLTFAGAKHKVLLYHDNKNLHGFCKEPNCIIYRGSLGICSNTQTQYLMNDFNGTI